MSMLSKISRLVVVMMVVFACQIEICLFADELQGKWGRGGVKRTVLNSYKIVSVEDENAESKKLTGKWGRGGIRVKLGESDTKYSAKNDIPSRVHNNR